MDQYYLKKTPLAAKLLTFSGIAITSLRGIADLLEGKGMSFRKLNCPIMYKDGVINIEDCIAKGSSVVITAKGKWILKTIWSI